MGLLLLLFLVGMYVLHSISSFIGWYNFYIVPLHDAAMVTQAASGGSESLAIPFNSTLIQDPGLLMTVTADTWLGMIVGVVPLFLLFAAIVLAVLFYVVLICVQVLCGKLIKWFDPCIECCMRDESNSSKKQRRHLKEEERSSTSSGNSGGGDAEGIEV